MLRCIKCGRRPASTSSTSNFFGMHFTMRGDMGEVFSILLFSFLFFSRAREGKRTDNLLIYWALWSFGVAHRLFANSEPVRSRQAVGRQSLVGSCRVVAQGPYYFAPHKNRLCERYAMHFQSRSLSRKEKHLPLREFFSLLRLAI